MSSFFGETYTENVRIIDTGQIERYGAVTLPYLLMNIENVSVSIFVLITTINV
jgi:hypothetical protein